TESSMSSLVSRFRSSEWRRPALAGGRAGGEMPKGRLGIGVTFVLAVGCVAGTALAAETPAKNARRHAEVERRAATLEARLSAVMVDGPKTEALTRAAGRMLDLSRRFLDARNLLAAEIQADV